jgi:signal transduction histidine kinase
VGLLVSISGAAAGRSIDLARQLAAVAQGGLGQLTLLDQADGVLAEKMDVLAKLDVAAAEPGVERTLGSSPLRSHAAEPAAPGIASRLHRPVASLQRALDELRAKLANAGAVDSADAFALLDECAAASREIHAIGAEVEAEAGDAAGLFESADLAGIVRRGVAAVKPSQPKSLEIAVEIDREPAPIRCQPFQLEQVVIQLVMNAAEGMHGQGRVQVELRRCPEGFEVSVSDQGEGIDPEILDRLFDPFFEAPVGTDAGLGLTICYRIVKRHGGELAVHSEPGRGTRVALVLPADL